MSASFSVEAVSNSATCNAIPTTHTNTNDEQMNEGEASASIEKKEYNIETILDSKGYKIIKQLAKTSQGYIYTALDTNSSHTVIVKIASKHLVDNGMGRLSSNLTVKLPENILREAEMLQQITAMQSEDSFVKYIDFFNDSQNYFFVMSFEGQSLDTFIDHCHRLIFDTKLDIKEWICTVQLIFKQMIHILETLHHKLSICHMDLSLGNILIKNAKIIKDHNGEMKISKDFSIVLCDFGLAQAFNKDFECDKFVGKRRYISPEAFNKRVFDARANDVWSIGVCLFKLCTGWHPYNAPNSADYKFSLIKNGRMEQLLAMMNKECFVSEEIMDLLQNIFTNEKDRITVKDIQNHSFLRI